MEQAPLLLGLLLVPTVTASAALGWWGLGLLQRALATRDRVRPLSRPASIRGIHGGPGFSGEIRIWTLTGAAARRARIEALARRCATALPVLLVPEPEDRPALAERLSGLAGLYWLPEDRPPVEILLDAAGGLRHGGPPLVIVGGPDALERPVAGEPPDAVLRELMVLRPAELTLLVLAEPGTLPPDLESQPCPPDEVP